MRAGALSAFVGAALLMVAALAVPGSTLHAQDTGVHQVVISVDLATGVLSYSQDPVYAYPGDRIVFSAPSADRWTVTFGEATPFSNRVISGAGNESRNVPVLPTAAARSYKYDVSVTVGDRTFTQDPEIVIRDRGGR